MEISVKGQVVHKRSISKKLLFFDIVIEETSGEQHSLKETKASPEISKTKRITVILKSFVCGEKIMNLARATDSKIHAGDTVEFYGSFEEDSQCTFQASSFDVINRWDELNAGKAFIPIPPR